jgi:hypothetical protein
MNEAEMAKEFVKRWARLTDYLNTCQATVLSELASEPAARQQALLLYNESLGSSQERRVIALQLALVTSRSA